MRTRRCGCPPPPPRRVRRPPYDPPPPPPSYTLSRNRSAHRATPSWTNIDPVPPPFHAICQWCRSGPFRQSRTVPATGGLNSSWLCDPGRSCVSPDRDRPSSMPEGTCDPRHPEPRRTPRAGCQARRHRTPGPGPRRHPARPLSRPRPGRARCCSCGSGGTSNPGGLERRCELIMVGYPTRGRDGGRALQPRLPESNRESGRSIDRSSREGFGANE